MITMPDNFEDDKEWHEGPPSLIPDVRVWMRGEVDGKVRYCICSWNTWKETMGYGYYEITGWAYLE